MFNQLRSYVGEVIRVRATAQLAVIVSDNFATDPVYYSCMVTVRYRDGREELCRFIDVDTFPDGGDVIVFRTVARKTFPDLPII